MPAASGRQLKSTHMIGATGGRSRFDKGYGI
jgi:hypothetical protein